MKPTAAYWIKYFVNYVGRVMKAGPVDEDIKQSIIKYVMEPNKAKGMKAPIKREIKPAK